MSIESEYDRDRDIENYMSGKASLIRHLNNIKTILDAAVVFKTKYPADATEIDQGIQWVKDKCQDIIDGY